MTPKEPHIVSGSLAAELERVTRRLQEVEDRIAIRELTARYNNAFDDVDSDGYADCFVEHGETEAYGMVTSGRERLASVSRAMGYGTVHTTSDPVIEIDGNRAVQTCSMVLGARAEDRGTGSATYVMSGRYRDELARTSQGWKFTRREWLPDAGLDLPEW